MDIRYLKKKTLIGSLAMILTGTIGFLDVLITGGKDGVIDIIYYVFHTIIGLYGLKVRVQLSKGPAIRFLTTLIVALTVEITNLTVDICIEILIGWSTLILVGTLIYDIFFVLFVTWLAFVARDVLIWIEYHENTDYDEFPKRFITPYNSTIFGRDKNSMKASVTDSSINQSSEDIMYNHS